MDIQSLGSRAFALAAGIVMLAVSSLASADPPSRVVRLGHMTGAVSFSPAGEDDWVQATMNRPMTIGDRLWVDSGARAELQIGGAVLRLNAGTSVTVLNLDDNISQLQLTQGTMNVRVRRFDANQMLEIDTPNLAFTVRQAGEYRIAVDAEGNATDLIVRKGQGEVYGEGASYVVDSRQPYRFTGTGLREYEPFAAPRVDDFDRWAMDRDRVYDTSISARYVSPDVIGYQDLDTNGSWSVDATYGNVWYPTRVAADWAPYRDGHWAWVDPWGWTWVDDAPWGFAVSHYGRWSHVRGRWGWVPGPVRQRAYYAPALVAFVGGNNFQLSISTGNVGGVAWFPLGPREVYRPAYAVSRGYFERVNVTNTVVNTTVINNYYNNTNVSNVTYVNRQVPGAVVAVPTTAFVQSQPVQRAAVRVTPQMAASAQVAQVAAVPTEKSVRGAAAQGDKPPARVFERPVVARTAPAPAQASFAAQQQQLQTRQGKPLDDAARKQIQAAPAAPAPNVRVVAQPKAAPPTATLPAGLAGQDTRTRGTPAPANAGAPAAPAQGAAQTTAPAQVAQPGAAPQPAAGANAERGKGQQRGRQPDVPPTAATQGVTPAPGAAVPQAASPKPPAPAAQPQASVRQAVAEPPANAEQRGKGQQRGKDQQRAPDATPAAPPPMAAPGLQPRVGPPSQTSMQAPSQQQAAPAQQPQEQARQAEQQKAREAQAAQQQSRQAEQQKAREAQAAQQAQQAEQQKARQAAQQQAQQAEQQKARQAQAAQQQAQQAEQQKARQAAQQQAREAQAAQQQQARQAQAAQQQAQQAEQQKARQAQAAQQHAARQAAPVAAAPPPQAQQQAPRPEQESKGKGNNKKDNDEAQKREEEARKQKG